MVVPLGREDPGNSIGNSSPKDTKNSSLLEDIGGLYDYGFEIIVQITVDVFARCEKLVLLGGREPRVSNPVFFWPWICATGSRTELCYEGLL